MKMMKLICSLAFAPAITLAATGCKSHKPVGDHPIPPGPECRSANRGAWQYFAPETTSECCAATTSLADFESMAMDRAAAGGVHDSFCLRQLPPSGTANNQPSSRCRGIERRPEHQSCSSRAIAMNAARRNTTARSANAARWRRAKRWPSWALIHRASAPSAMAKTSRWIRATTKPPGRKIAGTTSCSCIPKPESDWRGNLKLSKGRARRGPFFAALLLPDSGRRLVEARQNL